MAGTEIDRLAVCTTPEGDEIWLWTLTSASSGIAVSVLSWGATIQSVRTPDRAGTINEIALGFPQPNDYLNPAYRAHNQYFGSTIGRYANRIARGQFNLDGSGWSVSRNEGPNTLHGGDRGFDQRVWEVAEIASGVRMSRISDDGEEGFPGRLEVAISFQLDDTELRIDYQARSDARTVVNLTNHSYWNLAGAGTETVMGHKLEVLADSYLPIDEEFIPIGSLEPVRHSPFDFRTAGRIGDHIAPEHQQLDRAGGIDHTFVLRPAATQIRRAAILSDPVSGRTLTLGTSEPGLQVYTGNKLDGTFRGHGANPYVAHSAIALEPQHFPDSPNRQGFPSTILTAGRTYTSATTYTFGRDG